MSDRPPPDYREDQQNNPALMYANFDPSEWGPCDDHDDAVPFLVFFKRCALAAAAVAAAGAFFYMLEENKKRQKAKTRRPGEEVEEEDGYVHRFVDMAINLYKAMQVQRQAAEESEQLEVRSVSSMSSYTSAASHIDARHAHKDNVNNEHKVNSSVDNDEQPSVIVIKRTKVVPTAVSSDESEMSDTKMNIQQSIEHRTATSVQHILTTTNSNNEIVERQEVKETQYRIPEIMTTSATSNVSDENVLQNLASQLSEAILEQVATVEKALNESDESPSPPKHYGHVGRRQESEDLTGTEDAKIAYYQQQQKEEIERYQREERMQREAKREQDEIDRQRQHEVDRLLSDDDHLYRQESDELYETQQAEAFRILHENAITDAATVPVRTEQSDIDVALLQQELLYEAQEAKYALDQKQMESNKVQSHEHENNISAQKLTHKADSKESLLTQSSSMNTWQREAAEEEAIRQIEFEEKLLAEQEAHRLLLHQQQMDAARTPTPQASPKPAITQTPATPPPPHNTEHKSNDVKQQHRVGQRVPTFERSMDEPSATDAQDIESIEIDAALDDNSDADVRGLSNHTDGYAHDVNQERQLLEELRHSNVAASKLQQKDREHKRIEPSFAPLVEHEIAPSTSSRTGGQSPKMHSPSHSPKSRRRGDKTRKTIKKQRSESIFEAVGLATTHELLVKYRTLDEWSEVMRQAGLQSSNLIFGIDYTASNKYQGENSFNNRSLHAIQTDTVNPYQQVIRIMGKSLEPFSTSGVIPAYGFGDLYTSDWSVFSLKADSHCRTFAEVLQVYNEITPNVTLSGPTNFAPLIYQAIEICQKLGDVSDIVKYANNNTLQYHILVIVADGQVTNERATRRAIVDACAYPLSIIVVGVGDGPWQMMRVFDESLPKRPWDNFHFVEFHDVIRAAGPSDADLAFAINALLEVPDQYKIIKSIGLL